MATSLEKPHVVVVEDTGEDGDDSSAAGDSDDGTNAEDTEELGSGASEGEEGEEDSGGEEGEEDSGGSEGDEDSGGSEGEEDSGGSEGEGAEVAEKEDDQVPDEGNPEQEVNPNAGWAEVMAKILQKKTPESQSSILLKNKQLEKKKEKEKKEQLERKQKFDKKRAWEMIGREKPDIVKDRENERNLQRVATRGVVQLFNAVRKHQKNVDEKVKEAGGSERKKAKILSSVSKKDFISVLRGTDEGNESAVKVENQRAAAEDQKPAWSVLRDDFLMGASMKDWDKESDEEK